MNIEVFQTDAHILGRKMTFRVMTPDDYNVSGKNYPVLYMSDGQDLFNDSDAVNNISLGYAQYYKNYSKFLPQVIIVGIDCPMNNAERTALYTPYEKTFDVPAWSNFESHIVGQGEDYLQWIVECLKPWIDERFRTKKKSRYTAIGGFSTGAVIATYGIASYPSTFSRLLIISGALYNWMDCLSCTLNQRDLSHIVQIYLDVSTKEQGRLTTCDQFIAGAKELYEKFIDCGFNHEQLKFNIIEGLAHNQRAWGLRFPDALRWVFRNL